MSKHKSPHKSLASTSQRNVVLGPHEKARGRFQVQVVDARTGRVVESRPWQNNLILDSGLDRIATESWAAQLTYGVAGTGNTPTKDLPDDPADTYSQTGTTVTRDTGTRDFVAGDVGKLIRWTSGEEAYITALIGVTQVTVGTTQTVVAGPIDALYRVAQTGLTAEVKRSTTEPEFIDEDDGLESFHTRYNVTDGTMTFRTTKDFTEEVAPVNYTEVAVSSQATAGNNIFSRMLLAGAVTVGVGQLLRLKYELTVSVAGHAPATQTTVDGGITGWPLPYNITSITSNGTYWEVTLEESHHFVPGGKINIDGAKRPRAVITAASSTVSDFTITAAGHGLAPGETAVIEGMTPSGYNGSFLVDSVVGDDVTFLSVLNPGVGTVFGDIREQEPGTWYDGTDYVIASTPTTTTLRITNATVIDAAGADGTAYNNTKRKWVAINYGLALLGGVGTGFGQTPTNEAQALAQSGYNASSSPATAHYYGLYDGTSETTVGVIPATHPTILPNNFPQAWGTTNGSSMSCNGLSGAQSPAPSNIYTTGSRKTGTLLSYTNGTFYRDMTFEYSAGEANVSDIKMFAVSKQGTGSPTAYPFYQGYILFEEPQRKKNTYKLTLTFRKSWGRDLTTIPN